MLFRCIVSGNTVEFTAEHDIEAMLMHPQYEVVVEEDTEKQINEIVVKASPTIKKRLKAKE